MALGTAGWVVLVGAIALLADRWWPAAVLLAVPPLLLVAVPLLLLGLLPVVRSGRRRLAVVLVLQVLVGALLAGIGPGFPTDGSAPPGTPVRVFAWSTDYWEMSDDADAFFAFLREQDADVYLLQEYLHWRDEDRPIRLDDTARLRAAFPGYEMSVDGELLTLSRLPIVATHHEPAPDTGDAWYWAAPKSQRTDIRVGDRTVAFLNVHLPVPFRISDSPLDPATYARYEQQSTWRMRMLDRLRADVAGSPLPTVIAGDLNSPWMELTPVVDGVQAHRPDGDPLSALSWPVSDYSLPRLWRLDWLYTRGEVTVTDYRFVGGEEFSDHAGQEIAVVVPE